MESSQQKQTPIPDHEASRCPQRFRLIDDEEMLHEPDRDFLIDRVCSTKSLAITHGPSGHGKTTASIDASLSVATGHDWYGHTVKNPGPVVYIAAEGQRGLKDRIRGWKLYHGIERRRVGVYFILEAVDPLNRDDITALRAQLKLLPERPKLIVVDTWSDCMGAGGGDENSTKDTSRAIFAWRQTIEDIGATVWIVHHSGNKNKDRARGSSALKAAAETEISVSQKNGVITVSNLKQRDGALFDDMRLRLHVVPLGEERSSCVLVPADSPSTKAVPDRLSARAVNPLMWLRKKEDAQSKTPGATRGLTFSDWKALTRQSDATFERARSELVERGYVEKSGEGRGAPYQTTQKGRDYPHPQIAPTDTFIEGRPSLPPSTVTPRRGDGGGGDGNQEGEAAGRGSESRAGLTAVDDIDAVKPGAAT